MFKNVEFQDLEVIVDERRFSFGKSLMAPRGVKENCNAQIPNSNSQVEEPESGPC